MDAGICCQATASGNLRSVTLPGDCMKTIEEPRPAALLLREEQAAALLGLAPRTLADWRMAGKGPRFVRLSKRAVRYSKAELERWIEAQSYQSTSAESTAT